MEALEIQIKIKSYCIILFLFFALFNANITYGAELFFEPKTQEIKTEDYFQVDLYLKPQNEDINAIEGKIIIPENLMEVAEIIDGDSIVSFWTEKPSVNSLKDTNINTNQREIVFGGVIPGGFKGVLDPFKEGYQPGKILSLILRTKIDGQGFIVIEDAKAFLNDGLGTETKLSVINFQFSINEEAPGIAGLLPIKDPDPPESFEPALARNPNVFDNQWFLAFATQDKGSGVDYYAVHESARKKNAAQIDARDWIEITSPYLLKDQDLKSYIFVKAVDKAGNEKVAVLEPQNHPRSSILGYGNYGFGVIILIIAISYIIKRKLETKNEKQGYETK